MGAASTKLKAAALACAMLCGFSQSLQAQTQTGDGERIEIGLSTNRVEIKADFAGEQLTIFGAVDNVDPLVQRQGRYDIFVILEGPSSDVTARRKSRNFGIWMNTSEHEFATVPVSYLVASTRFARDVTDTDTRRKLQLSIADLRLGDDDEAAVDAEDFADALRRIKQEQGLYRSFPSGVQFISQSLFSARVNLPANVPVGPHKASAYLFRQGKLVAQTSQKLVIAKAGLEYALFDYAKNRGLIYGLAAVAMALLIGWLGRVLFRKD